MLRQCTVEIQEEVGVQVFGLPVIGIVVLVFVVVEAVGCDDKMVTVMVPLTHSGLREIFTL